MSRSRLLQYITLSSFMFCCAPTTFGNPIQLTTCPSTEELQSFAFAGSIAIGFDTKENKLHYLTILVGGTPQLNGYALFLSPVDAAPGVSPEANIAQQLAKLHSNSDTPVSNNIFISDELNESVEMCTYSSEDKLINAILYVQENSEDVNVNNSSSINHTSYQTHPDVLKFALGSQ